MNYIDVRDVVEIIEKLLQKQVSGERFILNAGRVTVKEFYTKSAEMLSLKKPKYKVTYKMALYGLWLFRIRRFFTGKKSPINREPRDRQTMRVYGEVPSSSPCVFLGAFSHVLAFVFFLGK